jgi:hypothetical protein
MKNIPSKTAEGKEIRLHYVLNGTVVTITAHTGESNSEYAETDVIDTITYDAANFPVSFATGSDEVTKTLAGYGLLKLLQDRTSQDKGAVQKIAAMRTEADRLQESAQWSELKERAASAPRQPKVCTFLAAAIAELKGVTVAAATANLGSLTKEQRDNIAANPVVADVITRLKAELKDQAAVDLTDFLA